MRDAGRTGKLSSTRGEVPKPHDYKVCLGTSPRATLSGRAALLTQEGVALVPNRPSRLGSIVLLHIVFLLAA